MAEKCMVCKTEINPSDAKCPVCGFTDLHKDFISKDDAKNWMKTVIEPYRNEWNLSKNNEIKEQQESNSSAAALDILGMNYANGSGVSKDINKAISLYEQAIDKGSALAAYNLALVYDKTTTEYPNDYERAFKYYKLAEERGVSFDSLFYNIGRLYADGQGVKKNVKMAIKYYKKAISLGSITAKDNLNVLIVLYRVIPFIIILATVTIGPILFGATQIGSVLFLISVFGAIIVGLIKIFDFFDF